MPRYITCCNCEGTKGTMVKAADNKYAHQDPKECTAERRRQRDQAKVDRGVADLVIAKPRVILPHEVRKR